jgi:hypothetical protein
MKYKHIIVMIISAIDNIDESKCIARKNKNKGIHLQCTNKRKKIGNCTSELCGVHQNKSVYRADQEINLK